MGTTLEADRQAISEFIAQCQVTSVEKGERAIRAFFVGLNGAGAVVVHIDLVQRTWRLDQVKAPSGQMTSLRTATSLYESVQGFTLGLESAIGYVERPLAEPPPAKPRDSELPYANEVWGFSGDGRIICRSFRGDVSWDSPRNRHLTFLWMHKANEALTTAGIEIEPVSVDELLDVDRRR